MPYAVKKSKIGANFFITPLVDWDKIPKNGTAPLCLKDRDAKSNLNSTDAKSVPQKLAPNLLFLNSHKADYNNNNFDRRGIFAHIHCSLKGFTTTSVTSSNRKGYSWAINSMIREKCFAK